MRDFEAVKATVLSNTFVESLRTDLDFDEAAFGALDEALANLADLLNGRPEIDRELAYVLYMIPVSVRDIESTFDVPLGEDPPYLAIRLQDAWSTLDGRVRECFSDR